MFVKNQKRCGWIGEIKTGEGKTTIVAMLAAIQVFSEYHVDVLTSNSILAEEFVAEKKMFFKILGISVDHNHHKYEDNGAKPCYGCDVVAGTISSFQFDFLRHNF